MVSTSRFRAITVIAVLSVVLGLFSAPGALAAPTLPTPPRVEITAVATLTKTASLEEVAPGETFFYTLTVGCSTITDLGCRGAVLTDDVPAPFVLVGATVGAGANTAAEPVITGNSVRIDWTTPLAPGIVGILDATTAIVQVQVRLPADVSHDVSGVEVLNNAYIEGTNFDDVGAAVGVTPVVPLDLATTTSKTLNPNSSLAVPGTAVVASLTGKNDSNGTVEHLTIQDPADPTASPNPFDYLGFRGFGTVTPPVGATAAPLYEVFVAGAWVPVPGGMLPVGTDPADVRGARVVFTGAIPAGASGALDLNLALTPLAQTQDDGFVVTNTVSSEVGVGTETASANGGANFTLLQNDIQVAASKSFDPTLVVAGGSSTVTLGATNTSTIPIETLTLREPASGAFPVDYTFTGIKGAIPYPLGAVSGTVIYHLAGGGTQAVSFDDGATPVAPPGALADVTSFEVAFEGAIAPGGETKVSFGVKTDPDATGFPQTVTNVVAVVGTNQGVTEQATASAPLYVYDEVIETYVTKRIRPSKILAVPGQVATVSLVGGLTELPVPPSSSGTTGHATQIVIQDPEGTPGFDKWWNAFDLTSIAQTPVPDDANLTVEYYDTIAQQWKVLTGPVAGPTIVSSTVPSAIGDVAGGVRFIYDYTGADKGFAPGTDLAPNFTVALRADGRYTPGPPYAPTGSTLVPNCAQTEASHPSPDILDSSALTSTRGACPEIELVAPESGGGPGSNFIDKSFGKSSSGGTKSVISRSGDTIPSVLRWGTGGYSNLGRVEITDTATPAVTPIAQSVFDAFNLTRVQPITPATDPLIAFDQITKVELYNGTAWVRAQNDPCPQLCIGTFPGAGLTTAEQGSTLGVRLTFVESPNRAAASVGNLDAPPVGSGVARSFGNDRPITLTWQVRDTRRSDGAAALGELVYNQAPQPGVVRNTVNATGFPAAGGQISADAHDDVIIIDVPITTNTNKNWLDGPLAIPSPNAGLPPSAYPLSRIVVTTRNTTPARVDRLWITDPAPGSTATVFDTQSFNRFIRIDNPVGADPSKTFIDLYFADGSVVTYDRASALALNAMALPGGHGAVVGYQARFEGRINSGASGVVETELRLNPINRATGLPVTIADSPVTNTAQGVVSDVDPPGPCPPPGTGGDEPRYACDDASATLILAEPTFDVEVTKSFTPAQQKEPDNTPIIMKLTVQPSGTLRAVTLIVGDGDAAFWNAFDLVGVDPSFALARPITRVQSCYATGGTFAVANGDVVVNGGGPTQCSSNGGRLEEAVAFINAAPADVHEISFQFWSESGLGWANPANPLQSVPVLVKRRAELRTGGPVPTTRSDQIAAPGQPAAGLFDNHIIGYGISAEISPGVPISAEDTDDAQYRYLHRQNMVSVDKTPSGDVRPGVAIPFELTFTNHGERAITDPVFTDTLPMDANGAQLIFDPDRDPTVSPYTFALSGPAPSPSEGLPLPTDPAKLTIDEQADRIIFTPPAGTVLGVGQTYRITIQLMLRPGITPDIDVTNTATIAGGEPFDDCVTLRVGAPYLSCSDTATVSPLAIPALSAIKYVKSDTLHGQTRIPEVFSTVNGYDCNGTATADGFYRSPCIPVTMPGGTETWRFAVTNSGTLPMDKIVSIDNLPIPGDQGLVATVPRESAWQPSFVGGVTLVPTATTPVGAVLTAYYSTSSVPCIADLNPLGVQCAPGAWLPLQGANPADVRSLKFVVEMPQGDLLMPGEALNLQFQTRTTPTLRSNAQYPIAYNSVSTGGSAVGTQPVAVPATEGRRVGVSFPTGSISLQKIVSGPAAQLAPRVFPVRLVCTIDGAPVTGILPLLLAPGAAATVVDGLPIGAECTASEGHFGQTSTIIGTATVGAPGGPIGLVTVENIYDISDLNIRKVVDAAGLDPQGNPIEYGPFSFSVSCTFRGSAVWADGYSAANPMTAQLTPDELWALAGLPVGSACTITENNALGAASTSFVVSVDGTPGATVPGNSVDVTIADGVLVEAVATNSFGAGSLSIEKIVDGAAGDDFGAGPFLLVVNCLLDTGSGPMRVWSGFLSLGGVNPLTARIDSIAAGASCTVTELLNGGANETVITPASVTIGDGTTVGVTVTNTFNAGSITVTKVIDGAGAALWGVGPFEVTLACTTTLGRSLAIPGGAVRELNAANGYTARYEPLLVGLNCTLTETSTGGATSTTITDANGAELGVIQVPQGDVEAVVANTFELGALVVSKTLSGAAANAHASDTFEVATSCLWNGVQIVMPGGAIRTFSVDSSARYEDLPLGAVCTVVETKSGGANAVTMTPASTENPSIATVTISEASTGTDAVASVVVDNRFDPPLPVTGMNATAMLAGGGIAAGLLLAGVALLLVTGRRRQFA